MRKICVSRAHLDGHVQDVRDERPPDAGEVVVVVDPRNNVNLLQHELDEVYQDLELGLRAQVLRGHVRRLQELELLFQPPHHDDADADAQLVRELEPRSLDQLEVVVQDVDASLQHQQRVSVLETDLDEQALPWRC